MSIIISLLPTQCSLANTVAIPNTFVAGQILPAASLNQNFSVIYALCNGNITNANISASAAIAASKIAFNTTVFTKAASGNNTWASGITGDTQPRITLTTDGLLLMGPGGVTAPDTGWLRTGTATMQLYGSTPTLDLDTGTLEGVDDIVPVSGPGSADQIMGWDHTTGATIEAKSLVAGSGVTITPAAGSITIGFSGAGSGTVTQVAMTGDGVIYNAAVTGSPIVASGTLVPSLKTQTANTVLAGPTSGAAAAPTFRALGLGDVGSPTSNQVLGVNNAGNAFEGKTITAGAGISVTPGVGTITVANTGSGGDLVQHITQVVEAAQIEDSHTSPVLILPDISGSSEYYIPLLISMSWIGNQKFTTSGTLEFYTGNIWPGPNPLNPTIPGSLLTSGPQGFWNLVPSYPTTYNVTYMGNSAPMTNLFLTTTSNPTAPYNMAGALSVDVWYLLGHW